MLKENLDVARTTHEKEATDFKARLEELAKKETEYEDLLEETEGKINSLKEENQHLLKQKQEKDLKLADLKMRLEQAQYVHKEKITKNLNESFELKEENASLWTDIQNLKEALDTMTEEQKGIYILNLCYYVGNFF